MKKQKVFLATAFSLVFSNALINTTYAENTEAEKEYPIKVPSIADGTPIGVNGYEVRKMIFIIKEIEKTIHGILDPATKQRSGKYIFQGKHCTVEELLEVEKNIHTFDKDALNELYEILDQILDEFIKLNEPYLEQAQAGKLITLKFMNEWATKHGREDTQLLTWAKEKAGHEFDSFKKKTTSFEIFYIFANDLISFLSDLIASCPRAWQQFIELQKKKPKPNT